MVNTHDRLQIAEVRLQKLRRLAGGSESGVEERESAAEILSEAKDLQFADCRSQIAEVARGSFRPYFFNLTSYF